MRALARLGALTVGVALAGCGSARVPGRVLDGPGATGVLYLADAAPGYLTMVDVASGRVTTRRLAELAPGDPPYAIAISAGRLVVYGGERTYVFDPGLRAPGRSLGASWFFLPAAATGRVWLALLDPRSPDTVRALRGVREVTVDGRVIVGRSARPPRPPLVALATGLVLQADRLELWDPVTGRILRRLPGVFPVAGRGSLLVSCLPGCPTLFVTDTRRAAGTREIRPGAGFHFVESYGGAFSPDGSAVAVAAATPGGQSRVAVVDLRAGVARLVGGARLGVNQQMAWAASGWLYFSAGGGRLAAYRVGAPGARLLPEHVGSFTRLVAR
jgi:hypothetical protein